MCCPRHLRHSSLTGIPTKTTRGALAKRGCEATRVPPYQKTIAALVVHVELTSSGGKDDAFACAIECVVHVDVMREYMGRCAPCCMFEVYAKMRRRATELKNLMGPVLVS